ncbi:hypothetical protein THAOC_30139, partial [Thalassiosira oceanica]
QAAAMTFDEVAEMVEAHNKSNRDFGMGIGLTVAMSMTVQSKIVGAYGIPMTYLTVPAVIDPTSATANADHVRWAQVPLVGATYNRDNRHFFQILTPIVAKTKNKMLLVGVSAVRGDGRRLWLKIIATECGAGSNYQTLSVRRKALELIYTGKNVNLAFTDQLLLPGQAILGRRGRNRQHHPGPVQDRSRLGAHRPWR